MSWLTTTLLATLRPEQRSTKLVIRWWTKNVLFVPAPFTAGLKKNARELKFPITSLLVENGSEWLCKDSHVVNLNWVVILETLFIPLQCRKVEDTVWLFIQTVQIQSSSKPALKVTESLLTRTKVQVLSTAILLHNMLYSEIWQALITLKVFLLVVHTTKTLSISIQLCSYMIAKSMEKPLLLIVLNMEKVGIALKIYQNVASRLHSLQMELESSIHKHHQVKPWEILIVMELGEQLLICTTMSSSISIQRHRLVPSRTLSVLVKRLVSISSCLICSETQKWTMCHQMP